MPLYIYKILTKKWGTFNFEKTIFIMILIMSISFTRCSSKSQIKSENEAKSNTQSYQEDSDNTNTVKDNEVKDNASTQSNSSKSVINNKTEATEKAGEKIDISSMTKVLEPILYRIIPDALGEEKSYSELLSKDELSMTAYLMMIGRYLDTNATDVEKNYDEYGNLKMKRSSLNQYLKAGFNKFDNSLIENIYDKECDSYQLKYLKEDDSYSISPADGGGWIDIKVLDAFSNGDGTYKAIIDVTLDADVEQHHIGKYQVDMVKNSDPSSQFKYSITNMQRIKN